MSKVSVIIPVYKVADVILNTLESVVNQTYKDFEMILVDDGTPDDSVAVAEKYLADKNVEWRFIHQPNSGLSMARNNGITEAKGEWIICPDSDDVIAPQTIEKMLEVALNTESECVFCGFKNVTDKNYKELPRYEGEASIYQAEELRKLFLYRKLVPLVPGMLLKKSVYDNLKYDKDCPYDEDIHFMWRLFYKLNKVAYINADYYNYYIRNASMVHSLKPIAYLKTSEKYKEMTEVLKVKYPKDNIIPLIYPKYKLGGFHVLSRSTDFKTFKATVIKDGYRKDIGKLIKWGDAKLAAYATLFCTSLKLFYIVSK